MTRTEIRITGFGGQGVVLLGYIIGRACAIEAHKHATMIQSFGPEARGSACSATLVVSDSEVLYPYVRRPDVLVVMSSEGCEKFQAELAPNGILVYERELVKPRLDTGHKAFAIPSTRIAESLGKSIVQNIVMLGFFAAVTRITSREEMRAAVKASVPGGTEELNLKAFDAGWAHFEAEHGREAEASKGERAALPEARSA